MKKFIILLFLFCPLASAETFIKVDGDTIIQRYEGDCFRAGFCEQNNQNIQAGWVQVIREDFLNAGNKYFKYSGGRVVEMNAVEKAAVDILEGQAKQAARDARDARLEVSQEEALVALVQVINVRLPAGQKITKQELIDKIKANR